MTSQHRSSNGMTTNNGSYDPCPQLVQKKFTLPMPLAMRKPHQEKRVFPRKGLKRLSSDSHPRSCLPRKNARPICPRSLPPQSPQLAQRTAHASAQEITLEHSSTDVNWIALKSIEIMSILCTFGHHPCNRPRHVVLAYTVVQLCAVFLPCWDGQDAIHNRPPILAQGTAVLRAGTWHRW